MTLDDLAAEWPDWRLWRSRGGALVCAIRRRGLSDAEWHGRSWLMFIEYDVPTLALRLEDQRDKERAQW